MQKKKPLKQRRNIEVFAIRRVFAMMPKMPILVGVSISIATLFLWQGLKAHDRAQIQRKTQLEAASVKNELTEQMQQRIFALVRMGKRWEMVGKPPQNHWEAEAKLFIQHYKGYQAIEWVDPSLYARWIVPKTGNETAKNFQLSSEKQRRLALLAAQNQRQPKVTRTVNLVQGGKGFLVCIPIFQGQEFNGFIVGAFRYQKIFDTISYQNITQGYEMAIFDGDEPIYHRIEFNERQKNEWVKEEKININGVTWRVQVWPSSKLLIEEQSSLPEVVLGAGMAVAFLLASTVHLAQKAQKRKLELEAINQKLKLEIKERKQALDELSKSQQQYQSLVKEIDGIVWEADAQTFQMTFISQKAERLLGYPLESWTEDVNFWSNHIHPEDRESAVNFCVSSIQEMQDHEFEYRMIAADGRVIWLRDIVTVTVENNQPVKIQGVMIDITAQKQAQAAEQESEERLKLALEAAHMGTWDWNILTNELVYSEQLGPVFGLTPGSYHPTYEAFLNSVHPEDRDYVAHSVEKTVKEGADYALEFRVFWPDGTIHWLGNKGQIYYDEKGTPIRLIGVAMDITNRKQTEDSLRESQEKYKTLFEVFPIGISITDKAGNLLEANPASEKILGITVREHTTRKYDAPEWESIRPDGTPMPASEFASVRALTEKRVIENIETGIVKSAGEITWISVTAAPIPLPDYGVAIAYTDITHRVQAKAALRESEERWQLALRGNSDGIWDWNVKTNELFLSARSKEMLGFEDHEIANHADDWAKRVHPDDIGCVKEIINDHFAKKTPFYISEHRVLCKDGTYKWILDRGQALWDEQGNPIRMTGSHTDVTDRKRAEDELREMSISLENAVEGISRLDRQGRYTFVNKAYASISGYEPEEMIGLEWQLTVHPDDLQKMIAAYEYMLSNGKAEAEAKGIRKDGSIFYKQVVMIKAHDSQKNFIGNYCFVKDITERKQAEKALQESQHFIQRMAEASPNLIYIYDLLEQGNIYANREFSGCLGYTAEEVQKMGTELFQNLLHPDDFLLLTERNKRFDTVQDGEVIETEYRMKHRSGEWHWLYSRDTVFARTADGKAHQILGNASDITKRKQMEEALHEANEQLKNWVNQLEQRNQEIVRLGELSDVLQACFTVEEAYSAIAQLVQPLFPNISGGIFLTNASRKLLEAVAIWGMKDGKKDNQTMEQGNKGNCYCSLVSLSPPLSSTSFSCLSNSFTSHAVFSPHECWGLRRGRSHFLAHDCRGLVCKHIHTYQAESLCVPMMAQGEAIGILYLSAQQSGQLTEAKQILATTVAEHIALALANLKLRETLQHQSIRDALTGLFNRRYLEESLEREIQRATRSQQPLGVIMLDVDHFKRFNDTFGHDAGDAVLRELGLFLKKNTRGGDIACRYGGEELTLILPEVSLESLKERAEQLRQGVKHLNVQHHGQPLGAISISVGVAIFPNHGLTGEAVVQAADTALYRAKKEGRDRVCVCA